MRPTWSRIAAADRLRVIEHLGRHNLRAALSIDDRMEAAVRRLAAFPESGRVGRVPTTREVVVAGTPFVIVYRLSEGEIRVLRVLHGAQRWPEGR